MSVEDIGPVQDVVISDGERKQRDNGSGSARVEEDFRDSSWCECQLHAH